MRDRRKQLHIVLAALLAAVLLCGCGASREERMPKDTETTDLAIVLEPNEFYKLSSYEALESVDFTGSTCYEEILDWASRNPDVKVRYTVTLPDGTQVANDAEQLDLSGMDVRYIQAASSLFAYLPALQTVDLGDSQKTKLDTDTLQALQSAYPELQFLFRLRLNGQTYSLDETDLDLSEADSVSGLLPWVGSMKQLKRIELGSGDGENSRIPWADIAALEKAAPQAKVNYAFTLYGEEFTLQDETMDINHIDIADQGALVKQITACMPRLNYLDMDFCGVDDEHMAQIRDSLPNATVVWRIWFGNRYTARTDTERILASNPDRGGMLTKENTQSLKYCTKVKYLDLGHNLDLDDISYVAYMPDLEVAVLAMNQWTDAYPLLNCPKLEYLEMQTGACSDLRPIGQLKNLKHLNICYCLALRDMSPIYDLDLERLWVGCISPIPAEQVEEYHRRHPQCEINTTTVDPTEEGWRRIGWDIMGPVLAPRYIQLRETFEYDEMQTHYNYIENDPKYFKGGWYPG